MKGEDMKQLKVTINQVNQTKTEAVLQYGLTHGKITADEYVELYNLSNVNLLLYKNITKDIEVYRQVYHNVTRDFEMYCRQIYRKMKRYEGQLTLTLAESREIIKHAHEIIQQSWEDEDTENALEIIEIISKAKEQQQ